MMDFRIKFQPPALQDKIVHRHNILLAGSCFTEHIGRLLLERKFNTLVNPNGIVFNPVSIVNGITSWIDNKRYTEDELVQHNEAWHSTDHHSRFSGTHSAAVLQQINQAIQTAHDFLKDTDWLIITPGTAFVYELKDRSHQIVANCHKLPANRFNKRLLTTEEIIAGFGNLVYRLQIMNPRLKVLFTISPVRHIRDGVIENNLSKAILIQAVHHLVAKFDGLYYFPSYEIVIDELRDYRFYADDMVHPNETAIRYVWQQFQKACIAPGDTPLIAELENILAAMQHRPFDTSSAAHQAFRQTQRTKIAALKTAYPYIDFEKELDYFA